MDPLEPQRKTRAIMFSDIKGYSRLMGEDEPLALRMLEEHNEICIPIIRGHGGSILKFIGDAILSAFESASDAVTCAVEIQRALASRNAGRAHVAPIVIRIGIHIGDVVLKEGDVFGDGVNIAARIEPLAEPGGVAISQTVYDMVKARPEIQTVSLGPKELKNIKESVNIYKVIVEAGEAAEAPGAVAAPGWLLALVGLAAAAAVGMSAFNILRKGAGRTAPPPLQTVVPASPQDAAQSRLAARDADWERLGKVFASAQTPASEKARLAVQFTQAYGRSPGIHPARAAELSQYLPAGPERDAVVALARSPAGVEATVRLRVKTAASKRVAERMRFKDERTRHDFMSNLPVTKIGGFVDVKEGEPLRSADGTFTFRYTLRPGEDRDVPVPADVFAPGPKGEAAVQKAGADLADDFLKASR